jgi:hypothetical protein
LCAAFERTTGFEPATSTLARWCSSQLSYVREKAPLKEAPRVGDTGIEPVTSSVSGKRATAAPIAQVLQFTVWRWGRDSNPRIRLCRPLPRLSATPPCPTKAGSPTEASEYSDLRADDGIRTRDIHLGKVVL